MEFFKYITLMVLGVLIAQFSTAQFTLSGEFRPRTEISRGYKTLAVEDQKASTITAQRTRLNFGFNNELLKTNFMLAATQDPSD